jgi:hypothetical protein
VKENSSISIIVPIKNDTFHTSLIRDMIQIEKVKDFILVDSSDSPSFEKIKFPKIKYFHAPHLKNRSQVLNFGAHQTSAAILWFLHSDCLPPAKAIEDIGKALSFQQLAGVFQKKYIPTTPWLSFQSWALNQFGFHFKILFTGTNGLFIRRDFFNQIGGFPDVDFLEDILMFAALQKLTKIVVLQTYLLVSSRKYLKPFPLFQTIKNIFIYLAFQLGVSPKRLMEWY